MLFDQHLHSWHSCDSQADPAANVEAAVHRGLAGLTFTEHYDRHPFEWPTCRYQDEAYTADLAQLRERFGRRIRIGKGIEIGYAPGAMDEVVAFLASHDFDLVILSVHFVDDIPLHVHDRWKGWSIAEVTERYLVNVLDAVRFVRQWHRSYGKVFDVLGHLDLVKRYTQRYLGGFDIVSQARLVDEILVTCLEANLVPEINTSTLRQGLTEAMPGPETVKRYAALGGTSMSIGSDAHRYEDVGAGFEVAIDMIRRAGLNRIAVFQERRRVNVSVEKMIVP